MSTPTLHVDCNKEQKSHLLCSSISDESDREDEEVYVSSLLNKKEGMSLRSGDTVSLPGFGGDDENETVNGEVGSSDNICQKPLIVRSEEKSTKKPQSLEQLNAITEAIRRKKSLSPSEKQRQMSIVYSRRKRIKQKMRHQVAEDQRTELEHKNERLREENKFLEDLLRKARTTAAICEREKAHKAASTAHLLQEHQNHHHRLSPSSLNLDMSSSTEMHHMDRVLALRLAAQAQRRQTSHMAQAMISMISNQQRYLDSTPSFGSTASLLGSPLHSHLPMISQLDMPFLRETNSLVRMPPQVGAWPQTQGSWVGVDFLSRWRTTSENLSRFRNGA